MKYLIKISLLALFLLGTQLLQAQLSTRVGEWRAYLGHNTVVGIEARGSEIYALSLGGMFLYDEAEEAVTQFSTIEGMSGISPTCIHYNEEVNQFFVGYEDGMVDYFETPDNFQYISDIQRNSFFTQKRINEIASTSENLYVATNFGMVIFSLDNKLPDFTIEQFGDNLSKEPVYSTAIYEGRVWVSLGENGVYSAATSFPNLRDPNAWQRETGQNGLADTLTVNGLIAGGEKLFARTNRGLYVRENGLWVADPSLFGNYRDASWRDGVLVLSEGASTTIRSADGSIRRLDQAGQTNAALYHQGVTYSCNQFLGLYRTEAAGEPVNITPDGPVDNNSIQVAAADGDVYIAPQGYDEVLAPIFSGNGVYHYSANYGWQNLNSNEETLHPNRANVNFARAWYDANEDEFYFGSWGRGLIQVKDGELQEYYDCENSGLSYITVCDTGSFGETRVSGMEKDLNGNLWVSMQLAQNPLVVKTPEGEWFAMSENLFSNTNITHLTTDDFGGVWMLVRKIGVVVYHHNQTLDDTSDDFVVLLRMGLNQGDLPSANVFSIAKDQDGFIWVGTDQGAVVFYDLFSISQNERTDAICPVLNQRCLLKDEIINAIEVDGGNRKWMATNNGVYLISEDGDEEVLHLTEENSPLLSNNVNDVSVDPVTGEVFFATSKGVVSYRGDATQGAENCDNVLVFPNPVYSDYDGLVTIRGIAEKSAVKIVSVSGMLVREIQSEGGTAVWDGLDLYGNRVQTGVYLALSANRDGEKACVGKFSVISR